MKKFWSWIKHFFTTESAGTVISTIVNAQKSSTAAYIKSAKVQEYALNLVKELASKDISSAQKRISFNTAIVKFVTGLGFSIATSTVNVIRELAYSAFKISKEENTVEETSSVVDFNE